jgi:CRISPR-associated protein Csb2
MFALAVELLAGRYVATTYNDRGRVEWPPHPARFFSALVATWADGDVDSPEGRHELDALRWLEQQASPNIYASATDRAGFRDVVTVFVPVNDASIVSTPTRDKLDDLLAAVAGTTDAKARAKAEKDVAKQTEKLSGDTARAIAAPVKIGKSDVGAALRLLPERRTRQPRSFPSASPEEPTFAFVWSDAAPPADLLPAFERLLRRLVRVGHSSTLVAAHIIDASAVAKLAPRTTLFTPNDDGGDMVIRWVSPGQVEQLRRAFELHEETEPRVLPTRFVRYHEGGAVIRPKAQCSVFDDDFIVLARVSGPRLPSMSTAGLSRQIRRALMSFADEPIAEIVSGHQQNGDAADRAHLAIVPLPVVGNEHADGAILGVGLILPREATESERHAVLKALGSFESHSDSADGGDNAILTILLGQSGELGLQRVAWDEPPPRSALNVRRWSRPSRRWGSATPVALDRNPGNLYDPDAVRRSAAFAEATNIVRQAVVRVLPESAKLLVEIDVVRSCVLPGSAKPRTFPRFPSDVRRPQRVLVHVRLLFSEPVQGPLLIGAGRFQGLGLCLPVDDNREAWSEMAT